MNQLILCIETATPVCSVALINGGKVLDTLTTEEENAHSKVLASFINDLFSKTSLKTSDLSAVAISKGPGSYTGLRIGVSTAKGLCYALDIPLISINTLHSMVLGMANTDFQDKSANNYYCPMIDARRMEVYTALFDHKINMIRQTTAEIIDDSFLTKYLDQENVVFFGDGSHKCKTVIQHKNAVFVENFKPSATHMVNEVRRKFERKEFENTAYFEPFYLKDFIAGVPKVKGLS